MRRILVDRARARNAAKRGGGRRVELESHHLAVQPADDFEALDEALSKLAVEHPQVAELIQLRYFGGLTLAAVCRGAGRVGAHGRHMVGVWACVARRQAQRGEIGHAQQEREGQSPRSQTGLKLGDDLSLNLRPR